MMLGSRADNVNVTYLTSSYRLYNSSYVDSYFTCHTCGRHGAMQWLVDSLDAGSHISSDQVGTVSFRNKPGDPTMLKFVSVILAEYMVNTSSCMDVLLIATQTDEEYQNNLLRVTCRGSTQQDTISYLRRLSKPGTSNKTVFLSHVVVSDANIVTRNNLVTDILVGSTTESSLFWLRNQQPAGGFNGIHSAGDTEYRVQLNDLSVIFQETVLLVKRDQDITSILLLTDRSSSNITVTCVSNSNFISMNLGNKRDSIPYSSDVMPDSSGTIEITSSMMQSSERTLTTTDFLTEKTRISIGKVVGIRPLSILCVM